MMDVATISLVINGLILLFMIGLWTELRAIQVLLRFMLDLATQKAAHRTEVPR